MTCVWYVNWTSIGRVYVLGFHKYVRLVIGKITSFLSTRWIISCTNNIGGAGMAGVTEHVIHRIPLACLGVTCVITLINGCVFIGCLGQIITRSHGLWTGTDWRDHVHTRQRVWWFIACLEVSSAFLLLPSESQLYLPSENGFSFRTCGLQSLMWSVF